MPPAGFKPAISASKRPKNSLRLCSHWNFYFQVGYKTVCITESNYCGKYDRIWCFLN
jgi:hypothetical protein